MRIAFLLLAGCSALVVEPGQQAVTAETIVSSSVTNDDTNVHYTMSFTGAPQFLRVYVDSDANAATGFATRTVGAEYLVENGNLYRYQGDGSSWVWSLVKAVSLTKTTSTANWTVARADLGETNLCGETATLLFDLDSLVSAKLAESYSQSASCTTTTTSSAPSNLLVSNSDSTVSYQFTFSGAPSFWRVYIDSDLNAATGFATGGIGADYLIENAHLYRSTGSSWGWTLLESVTFTSSGQIAKWTVDRATLQETTLCGEQAKLLFQTEDSALHTSSVYNQTFSNASSCGSTPQPPPPASSPGAIDYVFVITLENEAAAGIYGNSSASYLNSVVLANYAHATAFSDPLPDALPSEPHYIWMEAGTNSFSDATFTTDSDPSASNSTGSTAHLATQMDAANVRWMSYQEGITTGSCPISSTGFYAAKHNPFVFFRDIAGNPPSSGSALCQAHHTSYAGFQTALQQGTVAQYSFITPNLCHDMHGASGCPSGDMVAAGDEWLSQNLPPIIQFANAHAGVIFLVWDEPAGGSPLIPFFAIGPQVKAGYAGKVAYNHGSLTKTIEKIFHLPTLSTVSGNNDFGDLFVGGAVP